MPSEEYGAYIIDSMTAGTPRVIYGNVPNDGLIDNLATDSCVEVACLVDGVGLRPITVREPPAGVRRPQHRPGQRAEAGGASGSRNGSLPRLCGRRARPLTGALLTLPKIREMVDQMFEAERRWLGTLGGK